MVFFFSFYLDEPLTISTHTVVEAGKTSSLIHKESNFCPVTLRHSLIVIAVFSSLDKMTKSDEVTGRENAIWNWLFLCRVKKVFHNFFYQRVFESLDFENRKGGLISESFSLRLKSESPNHCVKSLLSTLST